MKKPVLMGAAMGLAMMWMLHGMLTEGTAVGALPVVLFVLAHALTAAILIFTAFFAARMSPRARRWIAMRHRTSPRHVTTMLASAICVSAVVHLIAHGGFA